MKVVEPRIDQLHEFAVLVIGLVELLEACKREFAVKIFPVPLDHDLFHVVIFGISCQIGVIRTFIGGEGASGIHSEGIQVFTPDLHELAG